MVSVVLQTSFLGDMVLTTPLLERLAREGPVHVVATPVNAGLLANHPAVRSVLVFDKRGRDAGYRGFTSMVRRLRSLDAQRAFLAQGSLRTAALALMAGIPQRIGFDRSAGRLLYSRRVPYQASWHHVARLWSLASAPEGMVERVPEALRPSLFPGPEERAQVATLLDQAGVTTSTPLIALAPGSVWATKRWPHYHALIALLSEQVSTSLPGARLVVIGTAGERLDALSTSPLTAPLIDATGALSLLGSAALLSRCRVLVTNDSAPLHLASAMNTPTVALFGPTVPAFGFGPLASRHRTMGIELACRPCHAHGPQQCPLVHWQCMRALSPESVAASVLELALQTG